MGDTRGVAPVVGGILLVAVVVIIAATVGIFALDFTQRLHEPSLATVDATTITFQTDDGPEGDECPSGEEVGVVVQLTGYQQADELFVIVRSAGGETLKTVWADPGPDSVGETRLLANEDYNSTEDGGNIPARFDSDEFVDIGEDGQEPYAFCKGDGATFEFYAESDGQRTALESIVI